MTLITNSSLQQGPHTPVDQEEELVDRLVKVVTNAGVSQDQVEIVNFYVSLKSKPLAILAGPAQRGKIALIQCLARVLMGGACFQCQMMLGHAWGAERSSNVTFLVEAQERLNTEKLFSLIEEAWLPENRQRIFLACLMRISPAELLGFFTQTAFQLHQRQLIQLGNVHLSEPIPFPPNLLLVGTMDTSEFEWWDGDLLSQTSVISWSESGSSWCQAPGGSLPAGEREFLRSSIRSEQAALGKLHMILGSQNLRQPVQPLIRIQGVFEKYGIQMSKPALSEAIIYLANSWSRLGHGLFDLSSSGNLAIALDLAVAQTYLPRAATVLRRFSRLYGEILKLLDGQFTRSMVLLDSLTVVESN
jgi:hypothetical protein